MNKEDADIKPQSSQEDKDALFQKSRVAFFNMLEDVSESYSELETLFTGLVRAMVNALDAKSPWTKGHSERVAKYSEFIAKKMGFNEEELKNLWLAGIQFDADVVKAFFDVLGMDRDVQWSGVFK